MLCKPPLLPSLNGEDLRCGAFLAVYEPPKGTSPDMFHVGRVCMFILFLWPPILSKADVLLTHSSHTSTPPFFLDAWTHRINFLRQLFSPELVQKVFYTFLLCSTEIFFLLCLFVEQLGGLVLFFRSVSKPLRTLFHSPKGRAFVLFPFFEGGPIAMFIWVF